MIFSLDIRRARKGDCLLLHYGTKAKPGLVMIDGGPSGVYHPHLRPRLEEIKQARKLGAGQPLPVDLLMVSHVDDDHIQGVLDLTSELRAETGVPLVRVKRLWHNSFDDLIGKNPAELTAAVSSQFGAASLKGSLDADATLETGGDPEVARSSLKVLASIAQGNTLRGDAQALGIALNPEFGGKLILAAKKPVAIPGGLEFLVAGPRKPELLELQKAHDKWLKEQAKKPKSGGAALAAYVDPSVPNLSSLVLLAQAGGKSMLLTGDARGDKILTGLEEVGALPKGGKMRVDVLKVPHHGSANNLDRDFFERIVADHYVFSGDGEHGNPERESLEMLLAARGKEPFHLHLTYPVAEIDAERKKDWEKEQAKEKKKANKTPRPEWSPAANSLAGFLAKHPLAAGQVLHIGDPTKPQIVNLLDPLGF